MYNYYFFNNWEKQKFLIKSFKDRHNQVLAFYQSKVKLSLLEIRGVSIIEVWNSKSLIVLFFLSEQYGKL
ncbi:hypothetical protein pb186bvf_002860 [Paramecium bursaria]